MTLARTVRWEFDPQAELFHPRLAHAIAYLTVFWFRFARKPFGCLLAIAYAGFICFARTSITSFSMTAGSIGNWPIGIGSFGSPPGCPACETISLIRSEEHRLNSSHANISYAVFCLK